MVFDGEFECVIVIVYKLCGDEVICGDGIDVRGQMIVALRYAIERGWCMFWLIVKDIDKALLVLATKFCDKGGFTSTIEWPLHLYDKLVYEKGFGVTGVIIIVWLDNDS